MYIYIDIITCAGYRVALYNFLFYSSFPPPRSFSLSERLFPLFSITLSRFVGDFWAFCLLWIWTFFFILLSMEVLSHSSTFLLPAIPPDQRPSLTYALVVLNQSVPRFLPLLWKHAHLRLCADGGANRVYDELPLLFPHEDALDVRKRYKPDVIKGDMDSIRTEVLDFYTNMGTKTMDESHDQDTTDLHKCVSYIRDITPNLEKSSLRILVAGALGGRFDHEMGNINVLCRFSSMRIILLSDDCLIHLLPRTHHHEIHIQSSLVGPHCGLIPIGMPSGSTTTTGLEWDLAETDMRFGGLISTSNIVKGEKITVRSDSDLLWTISIKKPQSD